MCAGVSKSGSPISRWTICRPARARTSKADSVPRRSIRDATFMGFPFRRPLLYGDALRHRAGRRIPHGLGGGPSLGASRRRRVSRRVPDRDDGRDEHRLRALPRGHGRAAAALLGGRRVRGSPPARGRPRVGRGGGVRLVGGSAAADGGGVGEGGARRPRRRPVSLGRREAGRRLRPAATRPRDAREPARPHRPRRRLPRMVRRLVRRGLLRALAGDEPARPGRGRASREPRRRLAPRRPVEPRRPPLLAPAAPPLLRLRPEARARPLIQWPPTVMAPVQRSVLREGIVAGLIGATVVAVWFLLFDLARGRPLLTPGLLGAAVFEGVTDPSGLRITVGHVLGYTVVHGLAFIAFGVVAASLMAVSEREPALFVGFVILFACFEAFFFAMVQVFGLSKTGELTWWSVLVGNLLASVAMLWYFFRLHRALPRTLVGAWGAVLGAGVLAGVVVAAVAALCVFATD